MDDLGKVLYECYWTARKDEFGEEEKLPWDQLSGAAKDMWRATAQKFAQHLGQ